MSLRAALKKQFDYARSRGWLIHFATAAAKYGFSTSDLMGIASRESNMKNIKGDFRDGYHHGFSLMQLDIGSHRKWIESGKWEDAEAAIFKGAEALAEKQRQILNTSKQKTARVKFSSGKTVSFNTKPLSGAALRHCTLAAYNCGLASYYHYSIGNNIDRGTTGQNYGIDVIARSVIFQQFLNDSPPPVTPAIALPAESVAEQEAAEADESAAQAESPAEVSPDTDVDLLGTAVNSARVKTVGTKLWPRIARPVTTAATSIAAIVVANKIASSLVLLLILAGIALIVWWNWQWVKAQLVKRLKG